MEQERSKKFNRKHLSALRGKLDSSIGDLDDDERVLLDGLFQLANRDREVRLSDGSFVVI